MKQIISMIKSRIADLSKEEESLMKDVAGAQRIYSSNKNEALFNRWMDSMNDLSTVEGSIRALYNAYLTLCPSLCIEPQSREEIISELTAKREKRAANKTQTVEPKSE